MIIVASKSFDADIEFCLSVLLREYFYVLIRSFVQQPDAAKFEARQHEDCPVPLRPKELFFLVYKFCFIILQLPIGSSVKKGGMKLSEHVTNP